MGEGEGRVLGTLWKEVASVKKTFMLLRYQRHRANRKCEAENAKNPHKRSNVDVFKKSCSFWQPEIAHWQVFPES